MTETKIAAAAATAARDVPERPWPAGGTPEFPSRYSTTISREDIFKYHRPRGIVAAGAEEPNAIVQIDGEDDEPSARATTLPLRAGLSARSVNCWPSVGFDVNPLDAGCGWAVDMDKGDFIGRCSLVRDRNVGGVRPNVVGLLPEDRSFVPPDGTPLVAAGARTEAPRVIGYVSRACHSPNAGRSIALAVIDDGRRRIDDRIEIAAIDRRAPALVTRPCFVDPGGERMRG